MHKRNELEQEIKVVDKGSCLSLGFRNQLAQTSLTLKSNNALVRVVP